MSGPIDTARLDEIERLRASVRRLSGAVQRARADALREAVEAIQRHAGPMTDARVYAGVQAWDPLMAAGYTAAIDEIADLLAALDGVSDE